MAPLCGPGGGDGRACGVGDPRLESLPYPTGEGLPPRSNYEGGYFFESVLIGSFCCLSQGSCTISRSTFLWSVISLVNEKLGNLPEGHQEIGWLRRKEQKQTPSSVGP